ncbi:putative membrane protein [Gordonia insulae]|uniref:Putative membrane protein n=1 Tax=Gordonia insulae TaxID=2420509 RepID=A0A3G8JPN7_9ACTN|nr:putative membrane protein [Gordonia insulae]
MFPLLSPRRWPIMRLISGSPLIRRTDRVQALATCLAALVALIAIPLAVQVEDEVHTVRSAEIAEHARTTQAVEATAVEDSAVILAEGQTGTTVTARWTFASFPHRQVVSVDKAVVHTGDHFTVWVDPRGHATHEPLSESEAGVGAALTAVAFYGAALTLCALFVLSVRTIVGRHRGRAWDAALAALTGTDEDHHRQM